MKILLISLWLLLIYKPMYVYAQNRDVRGDTIEQDLKKKSFRKKNRKAPDPSKSFLYSMIFPSAGQFYNRKYWKVPIVLGGIAGGVLLINFHQTQYYTAKQELYGLLRDNSYVPPSGLTEGQLRGIIKSSQRDRDFFTILTVLWYFLQAVEAHTDAHLYLFSSKTKFQISLEPVINRNFYGNISPGVALKFKF